MTLLSLDPNHTSFSGIIENMSHANLNRCWHCLSCSGGCPFSRHMDYLPNTVLRMVQLGMKEQVLTCSTIWICVACNTCSTQCPNAIDIAAVMDALRELAIQENYPIAEPGILSFHNAVVDSIRRYGRTHKLEIMMKYKISERQFFSDMDIGLKMLAKRKLDLLPSKVNDKTTLQTIFNTSGRKK